MVNHRSPKPELQVRFLPLLPTLARVGGQALMPSPTGIGQVGRGTNLSRAGAPMLMSSPAGISQAGRGTNPSTQCEAPAGVNKGRRGTIH